MRYCNHRRLQGKPVRFFFCLIVLSLLNPFSISAHTRNESFSKWRLKTSSEWQAEGELVSISLTMKIKNVLKLKWDLSDDDSFSQVLLNHTIENLVLMEDGSPCPVSGSPKIIFSQKTGYVRMEWQVRCSQGTTLVIKNNAYFDKGSNHTHIARIAIDNDPVVEKLFTSRDRQWEIRNSVGIKPGKKNRGPSGSSLFNYWVIGADHIISGLDHIAFLLGLLLLCRRVRDVIILVTGFTLGHSVTLGLGVLDIINPDPKTVQALIGFTIALVAVEKIGEATRTNRSLGIIIGIAGMVMAILGAFFLKSGPPYLTMAGLALFSFCYLCMISRMGDGGFKLRPAVTFLFGLIHGFGFAGSLKEIGLPTDRFLSALFGFNIGVESGQLVIVFLLWQGVKILTRIFPVFQKQFQQRFLTDLVAASLCGLGLFWFISRAYA